MSTPEVKFFLLNAYLALDPNLGRQETLATKDSIGEEDWPPYLVESLPEYAGPGLREPSIDDPTPVQRLNRKFVQGQGRFIGVIELQTKTTTTVRLQEITTEKGRFVKEAVSITEEIRFLELRAIEEGRITRRKERSANACKRREYRGPRGDRFIPWHVKRILPLETMINESEDGQDNRGYLSRSRDQRDQELEIILEDPHLFLSILKAGLQKHKITPRVVVSSRNTCPLYKAVFGLSDVPTEPPLRLRT